MKEIISETDQAKRRRRDVDQEMILKISDPIQVHVSPRVLQKWSGPARSGYKKNFLGPVRSRSQNNFIGPVRFQQKISWSGPVRN